MHKKFKVYGYFRLDEQLETKIEILIS